MKALPAALTLAVSLFALAMGPTPAQAETTTDRWAWEYRNGGDQPVVCVQYWRTHNRWFADSTGDKVWPPENCRQALGHMSARGPNGECWDFTASHERIVRLEDSACRAGDQGNNFIYFSQSPENPNPLKHIVTWTPEGKYEVYNTDYKPIATYRSREDLRHLWSGDTIYVSWGLDGKCNQYSNTWNWVGWPATNMYCVKTQGVYLGVAIHQEGEGEKYRQWVECNYFGPSMPAQGSTAGFLLNFNQFPWQASALTHPIRENDSECDALLKEHDAYAKGRDASIIRDEEIQKLQEAKHRAALRTIDAQVEATKRALEAQTRKEISALIAAGAAAESEQVIEAQKERKAFVDEALAEKRAELESKLKLEESSREAEVKQHKDNSREIKRDILLIRIRRYL